MTAATVASSAPSAAASAPSPIPFPARPRRAFVAQEADLGDWPTIESHLKRLESRTPGSAAELERWLLDWSELAAGIEEERARRYVAMTCATDDPAREKAYLVLVEDLLPRLKPWTHKLQQKLLVDPHREGLDRRRYEVFLRSVRNDVELFREANVPLAVEDDKLKLDYQKINGAMTVRFDGEERTLQKMDLVLLERDRDRRKAGWEAVQERRMRDAAALDDLCDRMVGVRRRIAENAGFANYRDFVYREKGRFDYTPADVAKFRATIAETVVPVSRKLHQRRREKLGLDRLRPWDMKVDPADAPPLRPFKDGAELVAKCRRIFERVDGGLGRQFSDLADSGMLDLDSRKGKAPGGYQETFMESRRPFIFMNAVGTHRDLETMLHEAGHAFHAFATVTEPMTWYRNPPMEFCEVASMAMELLAAPYLEEFYSPTDVRRAMREHLEGIIHFLPHMATIDGFQDWVYTHPGHTRQERRERWLDLMRTYGPGDDWSGYEEIWSHQWKKQLHIFEVPFYYVEYGIAQLGALQVWVNSGRDYRKAVADYVRGLSLGGSRPLPELFEAAGIRFDFSAATIAPLMDELLKELDRLGD